MPLISVLLPAHNAELYIAEAVQSILEQTESDLELIVLNDGSKDNTLRVLQDFHDPRLCILSEEHNQGIVFQLNKGLRHATGKYIARMDADDIAYPNRFARQLAFFQSHPNAIVVGTFARQIGKSSHLLTYPSKPQEIDFYLNFYCCMLHPTVMIDADKLRENGALYEAFQYAEDYGLWIRLSDGKNIYNIPEVLLDYRIHDKQTNQISLLKQYNGTMTAREVKLRKSFPLASQNFIDKLSFLANEYNFYGHVREKEKLNIPISWTDRLLYFWFRQVNFRRRKPVTRFVQEHL